MNNGFFQLGIIYLLGIIVPGPSVSLIINNAFIHSRRASILAAFGIMLGIALQAGSILLGLNIFEEDSHVFKTFKILCASYLLYFGAKKILKKTVLQEGSYGEFTPENRSKRLMSASYFREGFLLEILNPIACSFFLSIFTIIDSKSLEIKFFYWVEIIFLGSIYFFCISYLASSQMIIHYLKFLNKKIEY